ncbi:lipase family protein [Reyranella aquatilis]|uniref:Lipase family protein n=1 Tax=Reyranella aquatilis TaxID=2035356 RepID=A0ABS8L1R1_9HYPH|nr:lipase family protein [Reyranella aquatilis]MCC8432257.1 lipase family protein [Reyranella aquatilis]
MSMRQASASPVQTAQADAGPPVRIARARLDALAAKFYPVFNEGNVLGAFSAERHGARYDVELRAFTTRSRLPQTGEPVEVSGLLAVPAGREGPVPVVSWQHGTILSFDQVPSNLTKLAVERYELRDSVDSLETLFNIQRLAGNGYAVIAADYLGKGAYRNGRDEAYAVKDVTVQVCLDVLQAGVRELERSGRRQSALFLNGWSQGALNTQWIKQDLQRRGIAVAATAAQSPFNDLPNTFHYWSSPQSFAPSTAASYPPPPAWIVPCLIVLLGSYRRYYGLADLFETAIRPQYRAFAEKYWSDYSIDPQAAKTIPPVADFLIEGLFERYTHDTNSRLLRRLAANSTTFWDYDSPIRFYYGLADEALNPRLVSMALASGGRDMAGVPVKGASHRATFLASLYGDGANLNGQSTVLDWFNSRL